MNQADTDRTTVVFSKYISVLGSDGKSSFLVFLFIYLVYSTHDSLNLGPAGCNRPLVTRVYFPPTLHPSLSLLLKEVSLMFLRCFSLSLLSLPFLSLFSSCLFYQQLSCPCKGQSLPICLTRPSDTHTHTLCVASPLHLFYLSCRTPLFSGAVQTHTHGAA